jgi:hypothetical protein
MPEGGRISKAYLANRITMTMMTSKLIPPVG